jgi:ribonuclease J
MVHHAELAHSMGLSPKHVLICEDGDQIEVNKIGIKRAGQVPAGFHYIDGSAGDLDERPLEERRMLAEFGVLQISAGVDKDHGTIIQPVRLTARGWFEGEQDRTVLDAVTNEVRSAIEVSLREGQRDEEALNKIAQRAAGRLLGQKYRRQPILLAAVVVL